MSGGRSLYGDLFQEWEVAIARKCVVQFKARYPWLRFPDPDDLLQECLAHWYFTRNRFQPGRGASIRTYMGKIINVRLQSILREQLCHKRRLNHHARSLDEPFGESGETLADVVIADQTLADIALSIDVQSALSVLTPLQQSICHLLSQGYPVKRIAGILGKPRTTVRDHIKRIREMFLRRGLRDY